MLFLKIEKEITICSLCVINLDRNRRHFFWLIGLVNVKATEITANWHWVCAHFWRYNCAMHCQTHLPVAVMNRKPKPLCALRWQLLVFWEHKAWQLMLHVVILNEQNVLSTRKKSNRVSMNNSVKMRIWTALWTFLRTSITTDPFSTKAISCAGSASLTNFKTPLTRHHLLISADFDFCELI